MKNIHILPTEKPSRLSILNSGKLNFGAEIMSSSNSKPQNIYITSDEEIKEGDWLIVNDEDVMQMKSSYDNDMSGEDIWVGDSLNGYATYKDNCKKIILTTDQDLIADGIQAIDDIFLEWFVENPSCESIEVEKYFHEVGDAYDYEIIIPKEEPKQETLEEAAERLYQRGLKDDLSLSFHDGVKFGAEWQAERMYSESDKIMKFLDTEKELKLSHVRTIERIKWYFETYFEQFKKKGGDK